MVQWLRRLLRITRCRGSWVRSQASPTLYTFSFISSTVVNRTSEHATIIKKSPIYQTITLTVCRKIGAISSTPQFRDCNRDGATSIETQSDRSARGMGLLKVRASMSRSGGHQSLKGALINSPPTALTSLNSANDAGIPVPANNAGILSSQQNIQQHIRA